MYKLTKIKPGIIYKSFKSFRKATFYDESSDRCNLINGKILQSYKFDGEKLVCFFDDFILVVSCGTNKIDWEITNHEPTLNTSPKENLEFELPSGTRFKWNWKEILDSFLMKEIFIAPSHQLLFISAKGLEEYVFDIFFSVSDPKEVFLNISEA